MLGRVLPGLVKGFAKQTARICAAANGSKAPEIVKRGLRFESVRGLCKKRRAPGYLADQPSV